ncbi:prepilin-type N-terminal cleavage/methylation domain-containing protein [Thalassotalea sp. PS06]|uniref:type IV pilus modification PilV family protein n=1 Tax=Thalassotalea sp. PS06 TaxID=2594005 RepID=UPI0011643A7A|nr:prepilin-type N-terminal cleavage/methylation domain-containing protein [Thalassotalea sp. PS06]QDP02031.1 prepilin-type N-terminal cleavage/methylation domain-containing protein [Thalassotalea sp. PS06]
MKTYKGFGLVEVLIALAILAVGLLAVGIFHSDVIEQSNGNKAKAEAIAIAQQRIEEMRNYTGQASDIDEFNSLFTITTGYTNNKTVNGNNATFTRSESISQTGDTKKVALMVSWQNSQGDTEQVVLESELGFGSAALSGQLGMDLGSDPLVRSATGRAILGAGQVEAGDTIDMSSNGDMTGLLDRGDGDLRLTNGEEEGSDVVLTLEDACELDDNEQRTTLPCTGFVEISGKVYIDTTTQKSLKPGEVYIKASDAAYCQRYYMGVDELGKAKPVQIDESTTTTMLTSNGDYHYFDYTCYLGGGWHGNIGVMLASGISQRDKICQGDPTSLNAFEDPRIAARRVYRGMAYAMSGDSPITDLSGDTVYYSVGVSDALKLPQPGEASHDFVISDMSPGSNEGELCILENIMVRTDSYIDGEAGKLFQGVPTDFFCLNTDSSFVDSTKMNTFGYSMDAYCPFDPSDPPSSRHEVSFVANIDTSFLIAKFSPYANTSDGADNCRFQGVSALIGGYQLTYTCDVYDWGNGWDGYVEFADNAEVFQCDRNRQVLTGISSDSIIDSFNCKAIDYSVYGEVVFSGSITKDVNFDLLSAAFSDVSLGSCSLAADFSTYTCRTSPIDMSTSFTGNLAIKIISGGGGNQPKVCLNDMSSVTAVADDVVVNVNKGDTAVSLTSVPAGEYNFDMHVIAHNGSCT